MPEVVIYKAVGNGIKITFLSSLFVAIGVFWLLEDTNESKAIAWVCTSLFGMAMLVGLFTIVDRRPVMRINEEGLWDRRLEKKTILWSKIYDAYVFEIHQQKLICLVAEKGYNPYSERSAFIRFMGKMNGAIGFHDLSIAASGLSIKADRIFELVCAQIERYGAKPPEDAEEIDREE